MNFEKWYEDNKERLTTHTIESMLRESWSAGHSEGCILGIKFTTKLTSSADYENIHIRAKQMMKKYSDGPLNMTELMIHEVVKYILTGEVV